LQERTKIKVLDIGTGVGVLAIAYSKEAANRGFACEVLGVDISKRALNLAFKNALSLGFFQDRENLFLPEKKVRLKFLRSNLLKSLPLEKFDIIMANLPYLPLRLKEALMPEVSFEPKSALFAGKDGLKLYRRLRKEIPSYLHSQSQLIFECSPLQQEELKSLFEGFNLTVVS
jgi:release factor glutamine methyltransferase